MKKSVAAAAIQQSLTPANPATSTAPESSITTAMRTREDTETMTPATITYLRASRVLRSSGVVIERNEDNRMTKVMPTRPGWGAIWVTEDEIAAGKEKPPLRPRQKQVKPATAPKRTRQPKLTPPPAWAQLVARVRTFEIDHTPKGWPAVQMEFLTDLADELEKAHSKLAEFLPLGTP
jgi:hypothetical protein